MTTKFIDILEGEGRFGDERRRGSSMGAGLGCVLSLRRTTESTGVGFWKSKSCELGPWFMYRGRWSGPHGSEWKRKKIFHGSEDKDCVLANRRGKWAERGKTRHHMAKGRKYNLGKSILSRYENCKVFAINSVVLAVWTDRKGCAFERLNEKGRNSLK